MPNTMKKFVIHATCIDSLDLQEQESYLIMGQASDLWRVKLECVGPPAALGTWAWASSGRLEKFRVEPTTTKLYGMDNSSLCVSVSSFVKRVTIIPS